MKISFEKQYLPMLAAFMAINDIRYYLNGFYVTPHPDKGVILAATDGHRLVAIYDEYGIADGSFIFPISKGLLAAAKKSKINGLTGTHVQINCNFAAVVCSDDYTGERLIEVTDTDDHDLILYTEVIRPIEGKFPAIGRIFDKLNLGSTERIGLNVNYLGQLKEILNPRLPIAEIQLTESGENILVIAGKNREIAAIIMAAKIDEKASQLPEFLSLMDKGDSGNHEKIAA